MLAAMLVATAAGPAMTRGNDRKERCEERIENRIDNFEDRFDFFDVEFRIEGAKALVSLDMRR